MKISVNGKITISISTAFLIVFSTLLILQNEFPSDTVDRKNHIFFSTEMDLNKKQVFILGTSLTGVLNNTHINEKIFQEKNDYEVYNLSFNNAKPRKISEILQQIIALQPEIIFYGISYSEFYISNENKLFEFFSGISPEIRDLNPKLLTLKFFKNILQSTEILENENKLQIRSQNTPFIDIYSDATTIANEIELDREISWQENKKISLGDYYENKEIKHFTNIIKKLKDEKINVIIFVVPLHKDYVKLIGEEEKATFDKLLNDIHEEFDVKIYDFQDKYYELPIWNDLRHVAYNTNSIVYSDDIANLILLVIDS